MSGQPGRACRAAGTRGPRRPRRRRSAGRPGAPDPRAGCARASTALGERRDAAQLGVVPVAKTSARPAPPRQVVPLNTRSVACRSGASRRRLAAPSLRRGLTGEGRQVDLDLAVEHARVGRDPLALGQQQNVAGHEVRGLDRGASHRLAARPRAAGGRPAGLPRRARPDAPGRRRTPALSRTTARMAQPRTGVPATKARAPAASSSSASGWVNCSTSSRGHARRARRVSELGP